MGNLLSPPKRRRQQMFNENNFKRNLSVPNQKRVRPQPPNSSQRISQKDRQKLSKIIYDKSLTTIETSFKNLPLLNKYSEMSGKTIYNFSELRVSNGITHTNSNKFNQNNYLFDASHVYMPFSRQISQPGGILSMKRDVPYWTVISKAMNKRFKRCRDVENAIKSYNHNMRQYNFDVLKQYEIQSGTFAFNDLLNRIRVLALELPKYIPESIPLLTTGVNSVIFLSQMQIGCLLANAFFCTFPFRTHQNKSYPTFPIFNFANLFTSKNAGDLTLKLEKLKCLFNYFARLTTENCNGVVSFERQCLTNGKIINWVNSEKLIRKLEIKNNGFIEDVNGLSEVDFANKYIGGGVITSGSVQEEIRFLLSPELIVSRLFCEKLEDNEALIITGSERFNTCDGYSQTLKFKENYIDQSGHDSWNRRYTQIIAIDAIDFNTKHIKNGEKSKQFDKSSIDRELNKAYSGFLITDRFVFEKPAIATGKWGCGAFQGDPYLKCLIQIIAASQADRDLVIFTHNDSKLGEQIEKFYQIIKVKNICLGELYDLLIKYQYNMSNKSNVIEYVCDSTKAKLNTLI